MLKKKKDCQLNNSDPLYSTLVVVSLLNYTRVLYSEKLNYSPSFLYGHSAWCSLTFLTGPLKVQPAPAYWQATRVPSHRYLGYVSRSPLSVVSTSWGTSCMVSKSCSVDHGLNRSWLVDHNQYIIVSTSGAHYQRSVHHGAHFNWSALTWGDPPASPSGSPRCSCQSSDTPLAACPAVCRNEKWNLLVMEFLNCFISSGSFKNLPKTVF